MSSLQAYIHEFDFYDEAQTVLENARNELAMAFFRMTDEKRKAEQKYIYENVDIDVLMESADKGFFASIGEKVVQLMKSVKEFFAKIISMVTGIGKDSRSDEEKANKVIKDNPEYKDKIIVALNKGELTITDIAKFESDYISLVQTFQRTNMDENSFKAKASAIIDKFNSKEGAVQKTLATVGTITAILTVIPNLVKACTLAKDSNNKIQNMLESFKQDLERNKLNEPSKARAIINALMAAIGFETKEYKERVGLLTKMNNAVSRFVHSVGKKDTTAVPGETKAEKKLRKSKEAYDSRVQDDKDALDKKKNAPKYVKDDISKDDVTKGGTRGQMIQDSDYKAKKKEKFKKSLEKALKDRAADLKDAEDILNSTKKKFPTNANLIKEKEKEVTKAGAEYKKAQRALERADRDFEEDN